MIKNDRTQIVFNVRMQLPGTEAGNSQITAEQMCRTMDKAYDTGKWQGWCAAMYAVREAAGELTDTQAGGSRQAFEETLNHVIERAGAKAPPAPGGPDG
jgi:hypothetical protein